MAPPLPPDKASLFDEPLAPYWPLNAVLIVLGAALLSLAFTFLDPLDPRPAYNPWTYAIATPIALLLLSAILSLIVSRRVEKTMQVAFLLSVLAHLLLIVYAMNLVIFSRMWPRMLEPAAVERHEQQQQRLRAPQYFPLASVEKQGVQPEFRRPVPTAYDPAELDTAESPALQLARADMANMVSPVPRFARPPQPHILELEVARPPTVTPSLPPAARARNSQPDRQPLDAEAAAEAVPADAARSTLTPADLSAARRLSGAAVVDTPMLSAPAKPLARLQAKSSLPVADVTAHLPKPTMADRSFPRRRQAIDKPPTDSPIAASPGMVESTAAVSPQAAHTPLARRSVARSRPLPMVAAPPAPAVRPAPLTRLQSAPSTEPVGRIDAGAWLADELPRTDSAGGRPGVSSQVSLPSNSAHRVVGEPRPRPDPTPLPSSLVEQAARRHATDGALRHEGAFMVTPWSGRIELGVDSTVRPSLRGSPSEGEAVSADIANLLGSGQTLQRSSAGAASPTGLPTSGPMAVEGDAANASTMAASSTAVEAVETMPIGVSRDRASGASVGGPHEAEAEAPPVPDAFRAAARGAGLASAPDSVDTTFAAGQPMTHSLEASSGRSPAPSAMNRKPPVMGGVDLPDGWAELAAGAVGAEGTDGDSPVAGRAETATNELPVRGKDRERTGVGLAATPLEIDAEQGPAGLQNLGAARGALLAKNDRVPIPEATADLFTQRFPRAEIGGPLATGTPIARPTPAFQQRLDRLKDPQAAEASAVEPQTELAIERGLEFLARYQRDDGSWRLQDFDTRVLIRSDTAATGLALLAFQGAGYTHLNAKYADVVRRGLEFLQDHQLANGDLYVRQDPASDQNAWLYSHAIAALALSEAYGMTQDPEIRPVAQRAVDFMVASQDPRRGGWRYRPGVGSDTSVSGWFMMAMQSARLAELDVPQATFDRLGGFLQYSQASPQTPYLYRYNPFAPDTPQQRHGLQPTPTMTSVGLLMRLYLGWRRDHPQMQAGADYLMDHLPTNGEASSPARDTYYWYYATQVIFHMGGEHWRQWHGRLYPMLIESQEVTGAMAGSWHPERPVPDLWGRWGGRLYVTTMNLLSLEVSYRHLPLYDATAR